MWKVEFYSSKVKQGIREWPEGIRGKFARIVMVIESIGPLALQKKLIEPLGDGLFEIRPKGMEGIARAFFCYMPGKRVIILHEFIKKTQKTPPSEMAIARTRMKEVMARG